MMARTTTIWVMLAAGALAASAPAAGPTPTLSRETIPEKLTPEVREQILRLYSAKPESRARAVRELGRIGAKAAPAVPYVLPMVNDGSWVRLETEGKLISTSVGRQARQAVQAMGPDARPAVLSAMDHKDPRIRTGAAYMLTVLRPPEAAGRLIAALKDPDSGVRSAAVASLDHLRDPAAVGPLIALLKTEKDALVAETISLTLGHFKDPRAAGPLLEALTRQVNAGRTPVWAPWALGQLGDPRKRALGVLTELLTAADPDVRGSAAYGLGWLKDPAGAKPLLKALKDPDPRVRAHAAFSLGRLGDRAATEAVIGLLDDKEPYVRLHAASSLEHLGDERALAPLVAALKDPDVRMRRHAAGAIRTLWLARPASARAPATLPAAKPQAALRARMLASGAVAAMVEALRDPDPGVRAYAAEGLQRISRKDLGLSHDKWRAWQRDLESADKAKAD